MNKEQRIAHNLTRVDRALESLYFRKKQSPETFEPAQGIRMKLLENTRAKLLAGEDVYVSIELVAV